MLGFEVRDFLGLWVSAFKLAVVAVRFMANCCGIMKDGRLTHGKWKNLCVLNAGISITTDFDARGGMVSSTM